MQQFTPLVLPSTRATRSLSWCWSCCKAVPNVYINAYRPHEQSLKISEERHQLYRQIGW